METGSILEEALSADRHDRLLLGGPDAFPMLGEVLALARTLGIRAVHPASNSGDRFVGALLLTGEGEVHLWDCGSQCPVLVIDGIVASTAGLQRVMELVDRCGATEVQGVALAHRDVRVTDRPAASGVTVLEVGRHHRQPASDRRSRHLVATAV